MTLYADRWSTDGVVVDADFDRADHTCDRCGTVMHFYFNGGEMDSHGCACGRQWQTRIARIELVRLELSP